MRDADGERVAPQHLRRIRFWLGIFIVGLVLSGVTAFPLVTETRWLDAAVHSSLI
ncbi:MAG TPA: hypothetical protein VJS11_05440 [Acidobacteriaceae bacterium]|nr:hypothetical protein [Acidobacteriaceae bacterium]